MTTLWILLAVVLGLAAGTGLVLWRLMASSGSGGAAGEEILASGRRAQEAYRPMNRLFAEEDFSFVASQPGGVRRLRRQRVGVMRLFLRHMRMDFAGVYELAKLLAPRSSDPEFASSVTFQALRFYCLWLLVESRCLIGWFVPLHVDVADLLRAVDNLREAARMSLLPAQAQGQPA